MKAIMKGVNKTYYICPVLCGYQVAMDGGQIENADIKNIKVFLDEEFHEKFEIIKPEF